jgi:hypothetical protein
MPNFQPASIAAMINKLRAMAAAHQVAVALEREDQTFGG